MAGFGKRSAHRAGMQAARPGDVVLRRKGFVMHHGIALGDGRVFHNTPLAGEHESDGADFARGHRVYVRPLDSEARRRALDAADAAEARRRYNLFTNNCEHTVSRASTGAAHSPQMDAWLVGLGFAAAALAATRHPGIAAAGFALGTKLGHRALKWMRERR